MAFERINRADDPRIVPYRDMSDPDLMRSLGVFVAEGRLVVQRAIDDGGYRVRSVLVNEAARRSLAPTLDAVATQAPVYVCEARDFLGITGYNMHRGCLAIIERPPPRSIEAVLAGARTIVVLEDVSNADNVGGVFRNAAALGADGVVLSPTCCDPLYRKAIRTSMAAVLRVPFVCADQWPGALARIRTAGFTIVALTPQEGSETLDTFGSRPRPDRIALVAGNEGGGLTHDVEAMADHRVRIPISDRVDSLNLAVAVGIALYRLLP